MVAQRRKHLDYLAATEPERYVKVRDGLKLRR
jgi:ribosomal protein S15P/S13E